MYTCVYINVRVHGAGNALVRLGPLLIRHRRVVPRSRHNLVKGDVHTVRGVALAADRRRHGASRGRQRRLHAWVLRQIAVVVGVIARHDRAAAAARRRCRRCLGRVVACRSGQREKRSRA